MSTLSFTLALLATVATGAPTEKPSTPHNILLVIADDLGTDMLRSYGIGKDIPKTPNIDALAESSVLFRNAWSSPLCSPTRACIQTGRFGFRTGVGTTVKNTAIFNGLSASEIILPEMLDAGTNFKYSHALFGKWHLNHASFVDLSGAPKGPDVVRKMGYGHHEGIIHNILAPDSYTNWPKVSNGVKSKSSAYATTAVVNDFLNWHSTVQEPYFAVIAFNAPHTPLHAPPSWLHSVNLAFAGSPQSNPRLFYKAMVEALDTELGRLLNNISSTLGHTTVIFMGDNGTPGQIIAADKHKTLAADHSKGSAYEGGVNVPMLISGPLVSAPGSECFALVNAVDIFATVAELADVNLTNPHVYPPGRILDSKSMVPYLKNPAQPSARRFNYTEKFFENTLNGAQLDEQQLSTDHLCQRVIESTLSPGGPKLIMCGQAIVENSGNDATIWLSGAPANAEVYLLAGGFNPKPNPLFNGLTTVSPKPFKTLFLTNGKLNLKIPFMTDGLGELVIPAVTYQKGNPADFFLQAAIQDPDTLAWSISNAIQVNQTINIKAATSLKGYKLISHISGGWTEFYYLPTDPRERTNLLANGLLGLNHEQRAAYEVLRREIARKLDSARDN